MRSFSSTSNTFFLLHFSLFLDFALTLTFLLLVSSIAANQPIDVKNVNLDNHIHEFRQIDICTGIKIPIGTDDMSLRFDAISNIKHILISNAPFESCEDIASVKCPGSATYCECKASIKKIIYINNRSYDR